TCHNNMIVVHLPGMRNDGDLKALRQRGDFAGLADAAYAVGVELDIIERVVLQQLAEAKNGELVFSTGDGNASITFEFFISSRVIRDHGFLKPAQLKWLEQRQHSFRVVQSPSHIRIAHEINVVADDFANVANEFDIFLHAGRAIDRSPAEAKLH